MIQEDFFTNGTFRTILADPPWPERGGGRIKRGADRHYDLMTVEEIIALGEPLQRYIHPQGAHLHLWVTNNFLEAGLAVMKAWGFRYVTMGIWAKNKAGLGQYRRGQTEPLLFGVRGKLPYKKDKAGKRCQATTLIGGKLLPRRKHSEKPEEAQEEIERISYGPYLELFARQRPEPRIIDNKILTWSIWGNEVESDIDL